MVIQAFGPAGWDTLPFPAYWACSALAVVTTTLLFRYAAKPAGRRELRASGWLLGFVLVIYLISYYGAYGPSDHPLMPSPAHRGRRPRRPRFSPGPHGRLTRWRIACHIQSEFHPVTMDSTVS